MISSLSKFSTSLYSGVAKPVMFRMKPDGVHERMIVSGSLLQKLAPFRWFMHGAYAYENPMLSFEKFGLRYKNPLGLSAGLDKDAKIVRLLQSIGFGFAECGSVTHGQYGGNPQPWYTRLPKSKSIVVNSGLRSEGATAVIKRVNAYPTELFHDFPLNISIAKTNDPSTCTLDTGVADYVASFKQWEKDGRASLYTINISCPNTFGGEPFTDPVSLEALLTAVDALKVKKPIFVKMPIDKTWEESRKLLQVCARHNVQGITTGNLFKDRSKVKLHDPFDDSIKGNFSGKPCWDASNELLERGYAEFGDRFVFSGVGGVFSAEDAYTKIRLGATFVQLVTGLIFEGPMLIGQINKGLVELLERDGFAHISEAIGVDNRYVKKGKSNGKQKQKIEK